jgi:2-oxoglutarate ferredoxin oxidoreductase subunit beta
VPLIKAAISHQGSAVLDVISPCVTFNNHVGSTKSFDFVRDHNEAVNKLDYVPPAEEITVDYEAGTTEMVRQHDGSLLKLVKLRHDYDPGSRVAAMAYLQDRDEAGEIATGLLYLDTDPVDLHGHLGTIDGPLNRLTQDELCPGADALEAANAEYR